LKVGDDEIQKPRKGTVEPSESFERDEESLESVEIKKIVEGTEKGSKLNGFGIKFAFKKMIVEKKVNPKRTENQGEEGGDVAD